MNNLYNQTILKANDLFDGHYLDGKHLYLHLFNELPDITGIVNIDGEKAFEAVKEKFADKIVQMHRHRWYDCPKKEYQFDMVVIQFDNRCMIVFETTWCDILHNESQTAFVDEVTQLVAPFKEKQRRQPLEVNLVIYDRNGLRTKSMEIKRTSLDLDLFYNEDFKETDDQIQRRLNQDKDKGIVLLHGLPGTGKTTYLRYLIGKIKKRVLFLSPSAAQNLMNPGFIEILISNPNTVLIIEDAENIIMDRRFSSGSSVSNLLNISDGLLADCLNVQLICTFNSPLTTVDNALLRKGRLIARYDFGKLNIARAQRLSEHLGFTSTIIRPMTVAEVANQNEKEYEAAEVRTIGFRN